MRARLFTRAALAAAVVSTLAPPAALAQAVRVEPRVIVEPRVVYQPQPATAPVAVVPDINIDLSHLDIQVPPIPPLAPLPPAQAFDIEGPNIIVNDGEFWFGQTRTEREELRQTFPLRPGATVELSDVDGDVQIDTNEGSSAEVLVRSFSSGQNPRKLTVEPTASGLSIRGLDAKQRGRLDAYDNTSHHVRLTLPRRTNLSLTNVSHSVRAGELDGTAKITNVSGRVSMAQIAGGAEVTNVAGTVSLRVDRLGGRGVTVSNVKGGVGVRFLGDVNAELQTSNIKGKVYVELPNVAVEGEMNRADFKAKVGAGGAPVRVSDVAGTVRLAPAQPVAEMITALRSGARTADRQKAATDLAVHVSNPQVRRAYVEALNAADSNSSVQATAVRELAPYVREPEVREAFLRAIGAERNSSVRATAIRTLAKAFGAEKPVRDQFLRALYNEKSESVRSALFSAVAKHTDDPAVVRALSDALRSDQKSNIRLLAAHSLAARVDDPEVYSLLLGAARTDERKSVRAMALDALSKRIRDRAELRELFVGYLDDDSQTLQFHALRGLVELGDASLKQRLVEKSRELILLNARRGWNDRTVLSALILLRRLDASESDRVLAQLETERMKTY